MSHQHGASELLAHVLPSPYRPENLKLVALLARARARAGLTQAALAKRLTKPQSYVAKIEGGERRLDLPEFVDYARALGVDPQRLVRQFLDEL